MFAARARDLRWIVVKIWILKWYLRYLVILYSVVSYPSLSLFVSKLLIDSYIYSKHHMHKFSRGERVRYKQKICYVYMWSWQILKLLPSRKGVWYLKKKSIVYTSDFFLTITACVSVMFCSSTVNKEKILY